MESDVRTLSLSFGTHAVLASLSRVGAKGIDVLDLALLDETPVDPTTGDSSLFEAQLSRVLQSLKGSPTHLRLCLPTHSAHYGSIPYVEAASGTILTDLVDLERRHLDHSLKDVQCRCVAYKEEPEHAKHMLTAWYDGRWSSVVHDVAVSHQLTFAGLRTSLESAYAAFRYNYPEFHDESVALVEVTDHAVSLGVMEAAELVQFQSVNCEADKESLDTILNVLNEVLSSRSDSIATVCCYGDGLKAQTLKDVRQSIGYRVGNIERLNAFRLCVSEMDSAHRHFAQRMAHRFALCIGNAIDLPIPGSVELVGASQNEDLLQS